MYLIAIHSIKYCIKIIQSFSYKIAFPKKYILKKKKFFSSSVYAIFFFKQQLLLI